MFIVLAGTLSIAPLALSDNSASTGLETVREYFNSGEYEKAQEIGITIGTSDSYLLASEALTAKIILGHFEKPNGPAKQAREWAEKAIALDPDNLDARFHHAVAFGLETQSTGVLKAWRKKMPTRMRREIEALQDLAPEDPRGAALLGAWHLGIVNKVGKRNAYNWYKASPDEGTKYYEMAAFDLSKDDVVITSNYAASTIILGDLDYAQKLLLSVMDMKTKNAAEQAIQLRMKMLLSLYDEPKKLRRSAKRFLNNKGP